MTKNTLKILLLILTLTIISCKEELEAILETDYKVVEVDYGFDNYLKNTRKKSEQLIIKERNIVLIDVDKNGQIKVEGNVIEDSLIVSELKKYIIPNPENNKMPITTEKEFEYSGNVVMNKNLMIMARFNQELKYKTYSEIRNKIYLSFNEVRNEFSTRTFNKTLEELIHSTEQIDNLKWNELKHIFPIRYTELIEKK
ncbi:hypothetical protein [Flavivirga spongiicola]|uniref:DUF4230 domain-containing protein n=1 Tax=Flavivirga spongiicola TaxID=421621 RepID=A0ABU7XU89_9FLAO|nr:hypothetical protein [Flavivirga sp. MEBiC05379]MDO5979141.1 hypothetical protein [Flavivirga sp. MEBiC05379]